MGLILSWLRDGEELTAVECRRGALAEHAELLLAISSTYHVPVSTYPIGG